MSYRLTLITLLFFNISYAQNQNNIWYFGEKAGVSFNNGTPVALTNSAMLQAEGSASISDPSGNLLFYTDGVTIWNANHTPMPNGSGLLGHSSSTQSALIVPKPNSCNLYYVFTTPSQDTLTPLSYSIVDMNEVGGLGAVVVKNVLLHFPVNERLTGTLHSNGIDYWIVAQEYGTNAIISYRLSENGLNATPVVTNFPALASPGNTFSNLGYMKISKNGAKLCYTFLYHNYTSVLLDFNPDDGSVSNPIVLQQPNGGYGVEFSPDNSKLYVSTLNTPFILWQYDLSVGSPSPVQIAMESFDPTGQAAYGGALQLGPDGKIYIGRLQKLSLDVIHQPNQPGLLCQYDDNAVSLGGKKCQSGLPNCLKSFSPPPPIDTTLLTATTCDASQAGIFTEILTGQNGCDSVIITNFSLLPSDTVLLSATTCEPTAAGVFTETLTGQNGCDSIIVTTVSLLVGDTTLLFQTSCDPMATGVFTQILTGQNGCDSLVVTTVDLLPSDTVLLSATTCEPNQVGVFTQSLTNQNGCDSMVVTTVSLVLGDTVLLSATTCEASQVGVFTQSLTNQNGCDSMVVTTVSLVPADTVLLSATTCEASQAGIFTQSLTNQNGCDSMVVTTVALLASDTTALFDLSCNPASVGVFTQNLTNTNGCDSTVITTVAFSLSDTTLLSATTCNPTLAGTFTQTLSTSAGCDSTVITTVALLPESTTFLTSTTCEPSSAGIFVQNLVNQNGCDSTVTTTVTLLASSETFLTATTCEPLQVGVFVQNLTNVNGCDSIVTTTVSLLPDNETFLTATTCDPLSAGVFVQNLIGQNGCDSTVTTTVALLPTDTTYSFSTTCDASQTGTTTSIFTNQNGCDSVAIAITTLTPPPTLSVTTSDFGGFSTTCAGASDGWAQASATGTAPFQFNWQNGTTQPLLDDLAAGSFALTATDANGCTSETAITLTSPEPLTNALTVNALDCFDDTGGAITVQPTGGVPSYLYSINSNVFQPSGTFGGLSAGAYEITVQDANGCTATDLVAISAPVPLSVELGDDVFLELGDGTTLSALTNVPLDSLAQINWSGTGTLQCPGCPVQQVFPVVTTSYSIQVVDGQGCLASDGVTIHVDRRKNVYVPNAFSPNGDGINDLLLVFTKEGQVKAIKSFLVFDRWGESVYQHFDFQPDNPAAGWDGTCRGQLLNAAVFVWFAAVEFTDGKVELFEGDVVLVR